MESSEYKTLIEKLTGKYVMMKPSSTGKKSINDGPYYIFGKITLLTILDKSGNPIGDYEIIIVITEKENISKDYQIKTSEIAALNLATEQMDTIEGMDMNTNKNFYITFDPVANRSEYPIANDKFYGIEPESSTNEQASIKTNEIEELHKQLDLPESFVGLEPKKAVLKYQAAIVKDCELIARYLVNPTGDQKYVDQGILYAVDMILKWVEATIEKVEWAMDMRDLRDQKSPDEIVNEFLDEHNQLSHSIKIMPLNHIAEGILNKLNDKAEKQGFLTEQGVYDMLTPEEIKFLDQFKTEKY